MNLEKIVPHFLFSGPILQIRPLGEGLINDTFFVETQGNNPDYILQRKNKNIFRDVPAMMDNIYKVTTHLKKIISERGGDPLREALTGVGFDRSVRHEGIRERTLWKGFSRGKAGIQAGGYEYNGNQDTERKDYPIERVVSNDEYIVPIRKGKGIVETSILPITNGFFTYKRFHKERKIYFW